MKNFICLFLFLVAFTKISLAQDTLAKATFFDEGYLFIGTDGILKFKGYGQADYSLNNKTFNQENALLMRFQYQF